MCVCKDDVRAGQVVFITYYLVLLIHYLRKQSSNRVFAKRILCRKKINAFIKLTLWHQKPRYAGRANSDTMARPKGSGFK